MVDTLPEYVALIEAELDLSEYKGQITAKISDPDQLRMIRAAEERLVSRVLEICVDCEVGPPSQTQCVYVMVPPVVSWVNGKTTTQLPAQDLGRVKAVLQLLTRPNKVGGYTNGEGQVCTWVVWELECIHAPGTSAPSAALYRLTPDLQP